LPFCKIVLKAKKPNNSGYPKTLKTLGDHLRKKRIDLGLLQTHVANMLSVSACTVYNWETNRFSPSLPYIPKIIKFIGYVPSEISTENIKTCRQLLGITQGFLATQIGVDPGTLAQWEMKKSKPSKEQTEKLNQFFSGNGERKAPKRKW